jgi:uncharacterized DUF497 family protein
MAELSFEWDEEKNAANIKNHGIDFLDGASIFENPRMEAIDDRARRKCHSHNQRKESKPA